MRSSLNNLCNAEVVKVTWTAWITKQCSHVICFMTTSLSDKILAPIAVITQRATYSSVHTEKNIVTQTLNTNTMEMLILLVQD